MDPQLSQEMAQSRSLEMRERAARRGVLARENGDSRGAEGRIVIRRSAPGDGAAMAALAALDGHSWRTGPALVAEVEGSLRAALPLDGSPAFADPFRCTAELMALLELRASQVRPAARRRLPRITFAFTR